DLPEHSASRRTAGQKHHNGAAQRPDQDAPAARGVARLRTRLIARKKDGRRGLPPRTARTGPASPRRSACAPAGGTLLSRRLDRTSDLPTRTRSIPMIRLHSTHLTRTLRRFRTRPRLELLEDRTLLSGWAFGLGGSAGGDDIAVDAAGNVYA